MRSSWLRLFYRMTFIAAIGVLNSNAIHAADLLVGGATTTITPDRPVALSGQMRTRISKEVESPCTATALAIEGKQGEKIVDQAIFVSCDLVAIREGILDEVRALAKDRLEGFDIQKLILSATHTHTAPVMKEGKYLLPDEGVMPVTEYSEFLVNQLADVAVQAWKNRKPGKVGWGLGHAVVAHNRRAVYADGHAQMYGATDDAKFWEIEGYEDHGVEVLFFWDADGNLIATTVNIACPSQEVEGRSAVNADFWHQVRNSLRERHGENLCVLGWTGAAGDQSPHLMFREAAENRMRELRGLTRLEELSRRVVDAWEEAYAGAKQDIRDDVPFVHKVETIELPIRQVTEEEYKHAKAEVARLSKDLKNHRRMLWEQKVVDRYENQTGEETYAMELHAIRLGDIAIATNSFELFTDFGIRMKARSDALQTFVIQLAGPGSYLPTQRAADGGGYSAVVESSTVGPEGGRVLVEKTVELINSMWK